MTGIKNRLMVAMVMCMAMASVIVLRAGYIQVIRDPRLENMAKRQFQSKVLVRPRRGAILDRNNEPLAINVEIKSLAANPAKIKNRNTMARLLAKSLDIPYSKLLERLKEKREFVWIKRHLGEHEIGHLKHYGLIDSDDDLAGGLWMIKESKRVYPHGELAAHVLGDVNLDTEGLEGVELWLNDQLKGKVVAMNAVKDALGRPTFLDTAAAQNSQDGESTTLTLDASLQFEIEQELKASVARTGSRSGSVIVMNAVDGEILAMANEPSFNPNERNVPVWRRRNRAVTDGYEPGSTLKAVLLSSALSHNMKLSDQIWGERGSFTVQGKKISEAEAHEKFEWLSLKKIITLSSNVGAAKLALKIGSENYFNTLKSFGIGSKTDLGFPGEISGIVPQRKDWKPLTLANIGFGQGILTTPMQMLRAYATFANGGWLVQPTLLRNPLKGMKSDQPKRILTQKVADGVTEALLSVVEDEKGTGVKARMEGYRIAGKTGTAQVVDSASGKYSRSRYVASFIGFPVGVEPKVVVFAALDEPKGAYYAAETAVPLFKNVMTAVTNRFSIPVKLAATHPAPREAKRETAQAQLLTDQMKLSLARAIDPVQADPEMKVTADGGMWRVPSLAGLTSREALRVLQGHSFHVEVHGAGFVHSQIPEPGKPIAEDATIRLTLSE